MLQYVNVICCAGPFTPFTAKTIYIHKRRVVENGLSLLPLSDPITKLSSSNSRYRQHIYFVYEYDTKISTRI